MQADLTTEEEERIVYEKRAKRAIESLIHRGMNAKFAADRKEALSLVMDMIPEGASVGTADSATLLQLGLFSTLRKRNRNAIFNPFIRDEDGRLVLSREERHEIMRQVFFSDVYVIGTNAVTLDGKLVNTDAYGNRVAAMLFGPRKVIIVAGVNKITADLEEAMKRVRNLGAPVNAVRHVTKHHFMEFQDLPCTRTGRCADCTHPWKICNYTTIIEGVRQSERGRINLILVGERLGI